MKNVFIYLSGTIRKSHDKDCLSEWTPTHLETIRDLFKNEVIHPNFLNPATRSDDLSDEFSLFGRDLLQVYLSDFVLVDMREKRGIGVGYEIAFANFKNIPVVSWAEQHSHYRPHLCEVLGQKLTNWTHPFVSQTSQFLAGTLVEAVEFMAHSCNFNKKPIQSTDYPLRAIQHYLKTQLEKDTEMRQCIENYKKLTETVKEILMIPVVG